MVNIFLAPGTEPHLRSIRDGVSLELIRDVLKAEEMNTLERMYEDRRIRMWGAIPTLRSTWETMRESDIVLFVPRGSGLYKYYGEIAFKGHNSELAKRLEKLVWEKEGKKYEYIFYVKNFREINVDKGVINSLAGYKGLRVPGKLMRVRSPEAINKIMDFLSSYGRGKIEPKYKTGEVLTHPRLGKVRVVSAKFRDGKWHYDVEKIA